MKVSTLNSLKNCELPILFIHGEDDTFVPCEMSKQAFQVCGDKCRIETVEGAYHGMSYLKDENKIATAIKEFVINCGY